MKKKKKWFPQTGMQVWVSLAAIGGGGDRAGLINLSRRGLSLMYGGQTLKGHKSSTLREQLPSVEIKMRLYLSYSSALADFWLWGYCDAVLGLLGRRVRACDGRPFMQTPR